MPDTKHQTTVLILTDRHRITGRIALLPGARLTDFMCEAKTFIAITVAEVEDLEGRPVLSSAFLNIHRDHIRLILPAEMVRPGRRAPGAQDPAHG